MSDLIDLLEQKQLIWQGRKGQGMPELSSSGYDVLDKHLGGGLPKTGVVSINSPMGIGELRLLCHTLLNKSRLLVFVNPPSFLCAEFFYHQGFDLKNILIIHPRRKGDDLWATEQCLKSGACDAVLLWRDAFEVPQIKRFQIASNEGRCLQFLMRSANQNRVSLPVSLGMDLSSHAQGLELTISKRRGGWPVPAFVIDMSRRWPSLVAPKANNVVQFPTLGRQQRV